MQAITLVNSGLERFIIGSRLFTIIVNGIIKEKIEKRSVFIFFLHEMIKFFCDNTIACNRTISRRAYGGT